jgi:pimeloyl-ACP methyl ester carboxylesterase|tara:strand:- start:964 stop:1845 length:882 start_codon:yes stop_codon:yes gene_type:complete
MLGQNPPIICLQQIAALCFLDNELKFLEYGNPEGKTVIYFHGAPGSPEESSIFDEHAKKHNLHIICYDRFSIDSSLQNEAYYKYLASVIIDKANGGMVDIIGFSIGCHAAIETSLYLDGTVRELHLISSAAPLDAADFLNGMGGEMVFSIAMKHPAIFTILSYWQALLAKVAPSVLFKMLFASAMGEDKPLSKTADFKSHISPILIHCFNANVKGYMREINQYVSPWKESVLKCNVNTHIWHGTSDNWSPLDMANYLKDNISGPTTLETMQGLSHYTCLYAAAPKICNQLAKA